MPSWMACLLSARDLSWRSAETPWRFLDVFGGGTCLYMFVRILLGEANGLKKDRFLDVHVTFDNLACSVTV